MKYKIIIMMLFIVTMLGVVQGAVDTNNVDDLFKVNTAINYAKPCFNNGTYCSANTVCNYTFIRPDNTIQAGNVKSTNQVYIYNYSITFDTVGLYRINMVCDDDGESGSETFYAQVTGSGTNNNVPFIFIYLIICAAIIGFAFVIKEPWFGVFGAILLIPAGLYIINNGIGDIKDMTTTWAIGIVVIGIGAVIGIKSALEVIEGDE